MYPLGWALALAGLALHLPGTPVIAVANLIGVLGPAVLISFFTGGREAVRRLLAGVLRWRVGIGWYLVAILAMPAFTIPVSLLTNTMPHASGGWLGLGTNFLVALL